MSRMMSHELLNPMKWPVCLIALLVAAPAVAQTTAASSLSLQAAMERALAANPTLAAARLSREINVAGLAVARERLNPEAIVEIERETPKQAFGFVMPLELGGKRAKRIAVSEAAIRTGEAELSATIAQVRNDVRRAYFDVAVADTRAAIMRELRDLSRRVRDSAQARFESGESPRLEVLQADLAVAAAENEATAAEAVVVAATSKLNAPSSRLGRPQAKHASAKGWHSRSRGSSARPAMHLRHRRCSRSCASH